MNIGIVGAGHTGLTLAAYLAAAGHRVVAIDLPNRVTQLANGSTGFYEPYLDELVSTNVRNGRLEFSSELADAAGCELVSVSIGTDQSDQGDIDIDPIATTIGALTRLISRQTPIVIRSTMPIGSTRKIAATLLGTHTLVYCPDFTRQGSAIRDYSHPGKLVIGSEPTVCLEPILQVFSRRNQPIIKTNWETAEAIKVTKNAFNALKISFINEISMLTEDLQVSLDSVSEALRDETTAGRYLNEGFSYGGSCLPNNVKYLSYVASQTNHPAPLLKAIEEVNELRIEWLIRAMDAAVGGLAGHSVALWGLSYKADTDDVRDSPSLTVVRRIRQLGGGVLAFDPHMKQEHIASLGCRPYSAPLDSLQEADALVVLSRSQAITSIELSRIVELVPPDRIFDPVKALVSGNESR